MKFEDFYNIPIESADIMLPHGQQYINHNVQIPLMQLKYNRGLTCINSPGYNPTKSEIDEVFVFVDDRVLPNIIPYRYMVSNYGRIFDRVYGKFLNLVGNGNTNADGTPNPYYKVKLSYYKSPTEVDAKDIYIHRMVLLMFGYVQYAENQELSGLEVNHIDGNHANNTIKNLEWVTRAQNVRHMIYNGLSSTSNLVDQNLPTSDPKQPIRVICSLLQDGFDNVEVSQMTNTPPYTISRIRHGDIYREYSIEYKIPKRSTNKENVANIIKICSLLESGRYKNVEIAEMVGVPPYIVTDIKNRRSYTYISSNYTW